MAVKRLVILSGVSGAGKSTALKAFEDMGFFCVDNLPAQLIPDFSKFLLDAPKPSAQYALLVDCRGENFLPLVVRAVDSLKAAGVEVKLFYLDCQDEVAIRRYRETRRPHPLLVGNRPTVGTIAEAIEQEREILAPFRQIAQTTIDTTGYSPHDLRRVLEGALAHTRHLEIVLTSFGFKNALPLDSDLVIDVRFLPNPYFVQELTELTGLDPKVKEYVLSNQVTQDFLERYTKLLEFLVPHYEKEGKRYLTIAVGCTGGKHRSVVITECLAENLKKFGYQSTIRHRDIHGSKAW